MSQSEKQIYILSQEGKADLYNYNEKRKAKYKLRSFLKQIDLERESLIAVDIFLTIASDNGIELLEKDKEYLRSKATYQGKINYDEVVKDLALNIIQKEDNDQQSYDKSLPSVKYEWVLRSYNNVQSNNAKQGNQTNYMNLLKIKKRKPIKIDKQMEIKKLISHSQNNSGRNSLERSQSAKENEQANFVDQGILQMLTPDVQNHINGFGNEMQSVVMKIIGHKHNKIHQTQTDWSKQISAGSKKINLRKNIQNKIYIKSVLSSEKILQQKDRIRRYMKENDVDIMHLNVINGVFLDCDENRTGLITKKQLLMKIAEDNLQFPADFLFNLIADMQADTSDLSEDAHLKYENLKNIIEIYNNCPIFLKGDSNNSDLFKGNMDLNKDVNATYDRIDKLFRQIHARLEEKFKDFRHAFRSFDKDFGGSLDFKEFITGMEESGIKLKLSDYRLVFDAIDYDQKGTIGFYKFCLLNTDRKKDLEKLKHEHLLKQETQSTMQSSKKGGKPPLPPLSVTGQSQQSQSSQLHALFGDNIPKNKDINGFTKEVQGETVVQSYMKRRFLRSAHKEGFKTPNDLSDDHTFGMSYRRNHDMVALLTNSYSEEFKKMTIQDLKNTLAQKKLPTPKATHATLMRDKATRIKYQPLMRCTTASIQRSSSVGSQKRRSVTRNIFLQGSNNFNKTSASSQRSQIIE